MKSNTLRRLLAAILFSAALLGAGVAQADFIKLNNLNGYNEVGWEITGSYRNSLTSGQMGQVWAGVEDITNPANRGTNTFAGTYGNKVWFDFAVTLSPSLITATVSNSVYGSSTATYDLTGYSGTMSFNAVKLYMKGNSANQKSRVTDLNVGGTAFNQMFDSGNAVDQPKTYYFMTDNGGAMGLPLTVEGKFQFTGSFQDGVPMFDVSFGNLQSTAVPIPAAVWLLGSGLLGLLGIRRGKR